MKVRKSDERRDAEAISQLRGIDPELLYASGIRYAVDGDRRGWIVLPYPHRTGIWKVRYRNPDPGGRPKYLDSRGADPHLYNPGWWLGEPGKSKLQPLGPGENEVWFAEGEFDTLCLIEHGLKAVGVPGAELVPGEDGERQRGWHRSWHLLFEDTTCVVMFDNDDAGRRGARRLANRLNGVVFDDWPVGINDVNQWHQSDKRGLADALAGFGAGLPSRVGVET